MTTIDIVTKKEKVSRAKLGNTYNAPYKRPRPIPEQVCSAEDLQTMQEIHETMWENGWKLRTIGKRKHGWYFYIQRKEDMSNQFKEKTHDEE